MLPVAKEGIQIIFKYGKCECEILYITFLKIEKINTAIAYKPISLEISCGFFFSLSMQILFSNALAATLESIIQKIQGSY